MGSLFMIGATCFALGSLPIYFDNVSPAATAWTFFVGSIFFTTAGYVQYHEADTAPAGVLTSSPSPHGLKSLIRWDAHRIDWWAAAIQLVGTLFFNASTFAATLGDLSTQQDRRLIWAPDIVGSVCFLVASWLAYSEVISRHWWTPERDLGWGISAVDLVGSISFGIAAVGARYLRSSGDVANIALVNLGTFVGAVCFFVGAALLPVESATQVSGEPEPA